MKRNCFIAFILAVLLAFVCFGGTACNKKSDESTTPTTEVSVTSVELSQSSLSLTVGGSTTLAATVSPSDATNKNVTWSSSAESVATVSSAGLVSAIAAGTATITVTTADGNKTAACTVTVTEAQSADIAVTGVSISKTELSLKVGDKGTLTATVSPSNATNNAITWSSSSTAVATVTDDGVVTAWAEGTATITVTTEDGNKTATCTVTVSAVTPATVHVDSVSVSPTTLALTVGDTSSLQASVSPSDAADKSVTWSSSNTSVATVTDSGVVSAVATGTATITVTTTDGSKTATCAVTVSAATQSETDLTLSYSYAGNECAAFEWADTNPTSAKVEYKLSTDSTYTELDDELVRSASTSGYARADVVGLQGGKNYEFKITSSANKTVTKTLSINEYDRSGYAHFNYTSGVGAYNDDGTLKTDAIVVYVTEATKNTVTATIGSKTYTGIVSILQNAGTSTPLVVRIIGTIGAATWKENKVTYNVSTMGTDGEMTPDNIIANTADLTGNGATLSTQNYSQDELVGVFNELDTSVYSVLNGLTSKMKYDSKKNEYDSYWNMCDISGVSNVTVEGIGEDARIFQWGFTWKNCNSIEVRNLTFEDYTEDACSFEGNDTSASSLSDFTKSKNIWFHHNTVEQGINYWDVCAEQDKHEGDGGTDFKGVAYVTLSYNTYHENHKTGLIGGSDSQTTACVTFHHNYYNECQSRLPLGRQANMHMYNNYYYRSTGTNMSLRAGAYALIENCYFENAKNCITTQAYTYKDDNENSITIYGYAKVIGCTFVGSDSTMRITDTTHIIETTDRTKVIDNDNKFSTTFDTDSTLFYYDSTNKKTDVTQMCTAAEVPTLIPSIAGVQKRSGDVTKANTGNNATSGTTSSESSGETEITGTSATLKADDYTAGETFTSGTNDLFTLTNSSSSVKYTITALDSAGGSTTASASDSSGLTFSSALLPNSASGVNMTLTAKQAITITVYYTVSDSAFNTKSQSKSGYLQWTINGGTTQSDSNTANKDGRTAYAVTLSLSSGDSVVLTSNSNRLVIFGITAVAAN